MWRGSVPCEEMKRPVEPGRTRVGKKGKKEVMVEFSDAVMEETLKKQVVEAWSCGTPFSYEAIVRNMDPFLHCMIPNFIQRRLLVRASEGTYELGFP